MRRVFHELAQLLNIEFFSMPVAKRLSAIHSRESLLVWNSGRTRTELANAKVSHIFYATDLMLQS